MRCSEFINSFSDYFDGLGDAGFRDEAERHLASCASCRRYCEVVECGGELFRSAPALPVSHDFYPRLQHRIFHVDDAEALSRGATGSATTAATIVGMAILLTAVAWSPLMRFGEPEVTLSPIVVSAPPSPRPLGLRPPPVNFSNSFAQSDPRFERARREFWERSHQLLWEYSPLSDNYGRSASPGRAGHE